MQQNRDDIENRVDRVTERMTSLMHVVVLLEESTECGGMLEVAVAGIEIQDSEQQKGAPLMCSTRRAAGDLICQPNEA